MGTLGSDTPIAVVVDCDLADGLQPISALPGTAHALALVRLFTEPIGVIATPLHGGRLDASALALVIGRQLGPQVRQRLEECGVQWTGRIPRDGIHPPRTPRFLATRRAVLRDGPEIAVAVCTRGRADGLAATLASLTAQKYPRVRILVVDNAPADDRIRELVSGFPRGSDIGYVVEPRPGLSWARNRAIASTHSEVIAWADDDELCDPWWAAELARGFVEVPGADAVTGMVIPLELATESQAWFERYNGLPRGRGFQRSVFSPATAALQSPLYPLPPFGVGANMAFRRDALERIGRFDTALGAGTVTAAGEDTAALSTLLLAGGTLVYQPTAVVHHRHRRDRASLRALLLGYGRGLSAYYASMLAHQPSCALELARVSRRAVREEFSSASRRSHQLGADFPPDLLRAHRIGLLQGPFMYASARLQARRWRAEPDGRR